MKKLDYKKIEIDMESLCQQIINLLKERNEEKIKKMIEGYKEFLDEYKSEERLSIAFVGQYNAGKSSTIAALTGAKFLEQRTQQVEGEMKLVEVYEIEGKELLVGAQIMTNETDEYSWDGVRIIDTPGIYSGREDHDEKTLKILNEADLLVFVISNELFNPQSAAFFQRIIHDMNRSSQVLLVVNKMSREMGTPAILEKSLLEVMEPHHPEVFHTSYIDAYDYLDAMKETDLEEKEFLIEDSNFPAFLASLQKLIDKNEMNARLLGPINKGIEVVETSFDILSSEDLLELNMLELLQRKISSVKSSLTQFKNDYRSELTSLEYEVMMIGESIIRLIGTTDDKNEFERNIVDSERMIESASKKTINQIQEILTENVEQLNEELVNLQNSPLAKELFQSIEAKQKKESLKSIEAIEKKDGQSILNHGPQLLNKVGGFAQKVSRDTVYNFVKVFGGKFKPWGAIKLTRTINKIGPVFAVFGTFMDAFLTFKEEKAEENYEKSLQEARIDARKKFQEIADDIVGEYEVDIKENLVKIFLDEIKDIEEDQNKIRQEKTGKEDIAKQVGELLKDLKTLQTKIIG